MKKAYFSPVASLLMSLSLALGILVGDAGGFRLLTRAHAQEGGNCEGQGGDVTIIGDSVGIEDGLILSGITVHNVTVNGTVLEQAVIAGSVQVVNATVVGSTTTVDGVIIGSGSPTPNGVIIGSGSPTSSGVIIGSGSPTPNGVIIGSGNPCSNGVIIGSGSPTSSGVIIGSGSPTPNGVIIGSGSPTLSGVTGEVTGTAVGGTLTGDDIIITDGFIIGQNLLLSGATIDQGSIGGTITSITITPAN